jgi:hypothetical protein
MVRDGVSSSILCYAYLAVLLLAAPVVYAQSKFDLKYQPFTKDDNPIAGLGDQWLPSLEKKPAELKGVPKSLEGKAKFFQLTAGNKTVFMAVQADPCELYVDTDCDGDLSDEEALKATKGDDDMARFGVVSLKAADSKLQFSVSARFARVEILFKTDNPEASSFYEIGSIIVSPAGAYVGEIKPGKEAYKVYLVDTTFNGKPNDSYAPDKPCDHMAIDLDKDGTINQWTESMPLPSSTMFDGIIYKVTAAQDGSSISFEKTAIETGSLQKAPETMMTVLSDAGVFRLRAGDTSYKVPVGKYKITSFELYKLDNKGKYWTAGCIALNESENFEIRKGEKTILKIGMPLIFKASMAKDDKGDIINVDLIGQGGEKYFPYPRSNSGVAVSGTIKVFDDNGKELASNPMEYG